jgi:segregation and condensation protein A
MVGAVVATVSTPVFEGPLEVLLELVGDHQVDIYEVELAAVVEAFVVELGAAPQLDLGRATEFLVIAAILVELKSKKLLPGPDEDVDPDEELAGYEERDRLLARLIELRAYSAAADAFALLIEAARRSVPRVAGLDDRFRDLAPDLLAVVTADDLAGALARALTPESVPAVDFSHVTVEAVTVSEAVAELVELLPGTGVRSFRELTAHCTSRMQVIVRFLALLELCKRGQVSLDQGSTFGDLIVSWTEPHDRRVLTGVAAAVDGIEEYDG